jgi:hypothetical protein
VSPLDAHADRLSRTLLAAGLLVERCGATVVRMAAARRPVPRVSLWPALACAGLTAGWLVWVAWLVGGIR